MIQGKRLEKLVDIWKLIDPRNISLHGIRGRLMLLAISPVLLMTFLFGYIFFAVRAISVGEQNLLDRTVPALTASVEIGSNLNGMARQLLQSYVSRTDPAAYDRAVDNFERFVDRAQFARDRYLALQMPPKADALRKQANAVYGEIEPVLEKLKELLAARNVSDLPKIMTEELGPNISRLEDILSNIDVNNSDLMEDEKEFAADVAGHARYSIIFGLIAVVMLSSLFAVIVSGKMAARLVGICQELSTESNRTKVQAQNIAAAAQTLAQSSTESAAALQETAAAIEEMSAMIQKNSANASQSSQVSKDSAQQVSSGKDSINEIKSSVNEIHSANDEMVAVVQSNNRRIGEILAVINGIGEKTRIINDIVFQTKLLSFNASVEAARAGEQGKGFAVVAEEVGNLARISGGAAQEISAMLTDGINKVQEIVAESQRSMASVAEKIKSRVDASERTVSLSVAILDKIVAKSNEVGVLIDDITTASGEQAHGVTEISKSMQQLDQVSHENMTQGQSIANSSDGLLSQADSLNRIVEELTVLVEGGGRQVTQPVQAELAQADV